MTTRLLVALLLGSVAAPVLAQGPNLALAAKASASEFQPGLPPELANDGSEASRWSGIPGHNSGVWYELDLPKPTTIAEVLIRQYDRFSMEWDVQIREGGEWRTVQHFGKSGERLPINVLCTFQSPLETDGIRIANITNGPSFTEVELYGAGSRHVPALEMASDLRGNFVGILCDGLGTQPMPGQPVHLSGQAAGRTWLASATTDQHGMFFVKMPVGLHGEVNVASSAVARNFDATEFQRAITPTDSSTPLVTLKDAWTFCPDPPTGFQSTGFDDHRWRPIRVPAHWTMEGFHSLDGIGGYRTHFHAPAGNGRVMLRFDGVYSGATVWLNGHLIAQHEGGFTPFETDITPWLRDNNVLALRVVEHTNVSDNLDKMSQYADFPLAGIMRKVTAFRVPPVHVEAVEQSCSLARKSGRMHARIDGRLRVLNSSGQVMRLDVKTILVGPNGRPVSTSQTRSLKTPAEDTIEAPFDLTDPVAMPWSAEKPNLYSLIVELSSGNRRLQRLDLKIGLRQTTIDGPQILIDGTPVKFRGTCHHDSYPTMGRAVTAEIELKDVQMIKGANLNALRTSHYPPLPELLDDADRLGLYVEDEADFCWVGVADDLRNTPRIVQLTGELLARDRNHPSVFMWSLCNESSFGYGFERSHEWVRQVDPSRPTGAATSAWLEIATLHNPISVGRIRENEQLDKPLLFDEAWCVYQGIFNDVAEMWVDPGIRDYYAEPLPAIYDAFQRSRSTQGSMIWCWQDDLFAVPGRGIEYGRGTTMSHFVDNEYVLPGRGVVGDAPWGVVDGWRREKPEYWITKKLQSPIRIQEPFRIPGVALRVDVQNQYDFTNLSELDAKWTCGSKSGHLKLSVPPRAGGSFELPAIAESAPADLVFRDRFGTVVDRFRFNQRPGPPPLDRPSGPPQPLIVRSESILAGNSTHIIGKDFELAFDNETGALRQCVAGNQPLLLEFPKVHVLPAANPERALPLRQEWQLQALDVNPLGAIVDVTLNGKYPDFDTSLTYRIFSDGHIDLQSKFTYTGKEMYVRETGTSFSVPRACEVLSWTRKAEWNAYPDDHIGRPIGSAVAFPIHPTGVPPRWAWSEDLSPMGSNDFRSTKRHLIHGSISYPNGGGIEITSDGTQALRAMVETDRISVFISDWYGGTNVGWGEWITNYGRGKMLKPGDVITSHLRLRLLAKRG